MPEEPSNLQASAPQDLRTGLAHWMECVLTEVDHVRADFAIDPVHDLRVALRRCRSLSEGFLGADRDRDWKKMRREAKALFSALGELRDVQVLMEWLEKLGVEDDPVRIALNKILSEREQELKKHAARALDDFDLRQWRSWSKTLPERAARVSSGSPVFEYMALERWQCAHELHRTAMRNRSKVAMHQLRIGLKKLRYIVENFLPELHKAWGRDLKELQDALGEIHDLDVLWQTAIQHGVIKASNRGAAGSSEEAALRTRWMARISEERRKRIERYRQKMLGKQSLWAVWRDALPKGDRLNQALVAKLRLWAESESSNPAHIERVARIALRIYDAAYPSTGPKPARSGERFSSRNASGPDTRVLLEVAALLHDVGRDHGKRGYHKRSFRLVAALPLPIGWTPENQRVIALVARFHRGALPSSEHPDLAGLSDAGRRLVRELGGMLRLADALDSLGGAVECRIDRHDQEQGSVLAVSMARYNPYSPAAEKIAGARHLFETCFGMPVIVESVIRASAVGK